MKEKILNTNKLVQKLMRVLNIKNQPLDIKNTKKRYYFPHPLKKLYRKYNVEEFQIQKQNVFFIQKKRKTTDKVILYLHGGSYVYNFTAFHWNFIDNLAKSSQCKIVCPDYPLAPIGNAKKTMQMIFKLYKYLITTFSAKEIILMGDSAGGGLCLALLEKLKKEELSLPKKTILLSPWLDVTMSNPQIDKINQNDPFLEKTSLAYAGAMYANGLSLRHYYVSPLYGDLNLNSKIYVFSGTNDILNADAQLFLQKAKAQGKKITYYEYRNCIHCFMLIPSLEAEEVFEKILKIIA